MQLKPTKADLALFDVFYTHYPKQVAKSVAKGHWKWAITQTTPDTIIEAAKLFAKSVAGQELKYVLGPDRWLCESRWEDQVVLPKVDIPKMFDSQCWADQRAKVRVEAESARANLSRLETEEVDELRQKCRERYRWALPEAAVGPDPLTWPDGSALLMMAFLEMDYERRVRA